MRRYNPETDYEILLEAARVGESPSLSDIYRVFIQHDLEWPCLNPPLNIKRTPYADLVENEIGRAWKELGYCR